MSIHVNYNTHTNKSLKRPLIHIIYLLDNKKISISMYYVKVSDPLFMKRFRVNNLHENSLLTATFTFNLKDAQTFSLYSVVIALMRHLNTVHLNNNNYAAIID